MTKPYIHGMLPDVAEHAPAAANKAEEPQIRFLGDMQRLQPQPGDVFVLTCEQRIDSATAERTKVEMSGKLDGATVLVLDGGMKLTCIAAQDLGFSSGGIDCEALAAFFRCTDGKAYGFTLDDPVTEGRNA